LLLLAGVMAEALPAWGAESSPAVPIRWRAEGLVSGAAATTESMASLGSGPSRHVIAQFDRALDAQERAKLRAAGVNLLRYLDGNAYFARISGKEAGLRAAEDAGLAAAFEVRPEWKLDPMLLKGAYPSYCVFDSRGAQGRLAKDKLSKGGDEQVETLAIYVIFQADVELERDGVDALERVGGAVRSYMRSINGLVAWIPLANLSALAAEDVVEWIEPPLPPFDVNNDSNRVITQVDTVNAPPYGLDGSGINVLVYDGGTALASHVDFDGRLTVYDASGLHYHPTHVAGTIGGSGIGSAGAGGTALQWRGMAPAVTIASYGFEYDGTGTFLYTNPGDLEDDYDEAINVHGAMISNNSIGTNVAANGFPCEYEGDYGATSMLIDAIVCGSLGAPMRIIWANGNERGPGTCGTTYHTTAPPACAKNHITVGALNSNNDSMTDFSSWGPADDGRIKPDICAPGCQSNGDGGVTSTWSDGGYGTICGTSMAAPTVTGLGALILQEWKNLFPGCPLPRNSMLKVLLAHNAADLGNAGPDYKFGYGSVRTQNTIDFLRGGSIREDSLDNGGQKKFYVDIASGTPSLKVTIAWDDPPGAANTIPELVNNLDLTVVSPASTTYYPWTLDPANPSSPAVRTQPDARNNIEQVVVDSPATGVWEIVVNGTSVPGGPQVFSLAATPDFVGCFRSSQGAVSLNAPSYGCSSTAIVRVSDCDLNQDPGALDTVTVTVDSTSEPAGESVVLTEVSQNTGAFAGPIALSTTNSPGVLLVNEGDTVTARYHDDDNGSGIPADVTATAIVDCSAPVFAGLESASAGPGRVDLAWSAAADPSVPAKYNVYRDLAPGGPIGTFIGTTPNLAYSDTTVGPNQTYYYVVRAVDALGNEDTNTVERSATTPNWVTIGSGTDSWYFPMSTWYEDGRTQVIYLASEVGTSGAITSLALDVTTLPGQTMNNWTIRLKHTSMSSYGSSPAWEGTGWTVGYQANETVSNTGWVTFEFPTPFPYNGTDNLLIDFSFNNSSYTSDGYCRYTDTSVSRTICYETDSGYGDPLSWSGTANPTPYVTTLVPNLMLFLEPLSSELVVTPAEGFESSGMEGGPFEPDSKTYTLSNPGGGSLNWSVSAGHPWVDAAPASGTLVGGASTTVELALNANADTLPAGVHTDTAVFADLTNSAEYTRSVTLTVLPPTPILTVEELQLIGNDPGYPLNGHYVLTQDIDASSTAGWNSGAGFDPIGSSSLPFTGKFDGQGYVVTGLTINRPGENYVGLLAALGAGGVVQNLGLEDSAVTGAQYVGGLTGNLPAGSTVLQCFSRGAVAGTSYVGGLAGQNYGAISQSYATGIVTATASYAGGLTGWNTGTVTQCYATGAVTATTSYGGGLVGYNAYGTCSQSYATGAVASVRYVGGLAGRNFSGIVSKCYSTGAVTGTTDAGGLLGLTASGTVEFSFWDTQTSGKTTSSGGTGLTTAQMQTETTFTGAGWDFVTVWYMLEGGSYPYLANPPQRTVPSVTGLSEADAVMELESSGLSVEISYEYSNFVAVGFVISQSVPEGEGLNAGAPVHLVVSLGPESPVAVPDVVGLLQADAETAITAVGLTVGVVTQQYSETVPSGAVISQDPAGGTEVVPGSAVNLVVSLGAPPSIPISSIEELQLIGNDPAYPLDADYILTQDIDASATASWNGGKGFSPVGTHDWQDPVARAFTGSFDGQGHAITALTIDRPDEDYIGLFGAIEIGGSVENLAIKEASALGSYCVGLLVGYNKGAISNCHTSGVVTGDDDAGGLMGFNLGGTISQCSAACSVTSTAGYAGGLAGNNFGSISETYTSGVVTANTTCVGGLLGFSMNCTLSDCYSTCEVTAQDTIGGLVGYNSPSNTIIRCYATGLVNGVTNTGGLVGVNNGGTVEDSFWDTETSGMTVSDGGTGLPTAQMQTLSTFTAVGWDFDTVWYMLAGGSYPYLGALPQTVVPDVSAMFEADAVAALEAAGLTGRVTYEYSETIPEGQVVSQHPPASSSINAGTGVNVAVSLGPAAPVAMDDSYTTCADTPLSVPAPGVLGNDTDPQGAPLTAALVSNVSYGTLTLNTDGSFEYAPDSGYVGPDTFTYAANDGGLNSNVATVTITVTSCVVDMAATRSFWYHKYASPGVEEITVTIENLGADDLTALSVIEQLPEEWIFDSLVSFDPPGCGPATVPSSGATGTLEFVWTCIPEFPYTFTYRVNVPSGQTGDMSFSGEVLYRRGGTEQTAAIGCLGSVAERIHHSLDYNPANYLISVSEILRVIQFYNLGGYHCAVGTEDGYEPGLSGAPDPCCVPHDSDYNPQDWRISVSEILRVIQFYNLGGYHVAEGTEDGYTPGLATKAAAKSIETDDAKLLTPDAALPALYAVRDIAANGDASEVTVTFTGVGGEPISALGLVETLPEGWIFEGIVDASEPPAIAPVEGESGDLGFAWLWPPALPAHVTYRIRSNIGKTAAADLVGKALYRTSGVEQQALVAYGPPQTLYADANAVEQGDGTGERPFATIAEAVAASAGGRGDTIVLRPGAYCESPLVLLPHTTLMSEAGPYSTQLAGDASESALIVATEGCVVRGLAAHSAEVALRVGAGMHAEVTNCVLHTNGVGLLADKEASVVLANNTVYGNAPYGAWGGPAATFVLLANNVFAGNATALFAPPGALLGSGYNDWFGNAVDLDGPAGNPTDRSADPLFVDASMLDLRLADGSPCRDAGDPAVEFQDADGTRNDIGAEGGPFGLSGAATAPPPGLPVGAGAVPGIKGDVNNDGKVDAVDLQLVINAALGADPTLTAGAGAPNCDADRSGSVNAVDLQIVIGAAFG